MAGRPLQSAAWSPRLPGSLRPRPGLAFATVMLPGAGRGGPGGSGPRSARYLLGVFKSQLFIKRGDASLGAETRAGRPGRALSSCTG